VGAKIAAVIGILAGLALGATLGHAEQRVIDGDTLVLDGIHYRLYGIDAPESRQACADGWQAGKAASRTLATLVEGKAITCEPRGHDRYGRSIGICRADGRDLGAEMVRMGMALAFTRYSTDYVQLEAEAKAARRGVHLHGCISPWDWRAQRR
jgi:endonuclease YncB( thermonuclease family)